MNKPLSPALSPQERGRRASHRNCGQRKGSLPCGEGGGRGLSKKTIIATLNAKYIHSSLAVRWLYVANRDRFDLSFREYTIKENIDTIAHNLLATGCDCIGLGVYIWNVRQIGRLVTKLRAMKSGLILILGGPEVTYEPEFFLDSMPIDYVISGEGEFVLGELLHAIENDLPVNTDGVSSPGNISKVVARADIEWLATLPSPYQLTEDRDTLQHRLVYFETSRGCPFRCTYCLSSLEEGVRYFPAGYIRDSLHYLVNSEARQIKFLDRTFNLNKRHTQQVFDFLIDHYRRGLTCQFEIYADLIDEETIEQLNKRLPKHFFRFEIGVQSTYNPTNQAVNRRQDFGKLSRNIAKLMDGGKIDLHLDLIAGLPYETLERFIQSFNDVFAFKAKEVQLGFLKMLRGTVIREDAMDGDYVYRDEAPYEIVSNRWITEDDLQRIHDAEHALEKYWNSGRFTLTMKAIFDGVYRGRYFEFFDTLALYSQTNDHKYQLEDLYRRLHTFLQSNGIELFDLLREDYYKNFNIRPAGGFWTDPIGKKERKRLLDLISHDHQFMATHNLTPYAVKKQTAIDPLDDGHYLLTVFLPEDRKRLVYIRDL